MVCFFSGGLIRGESFLLVVSFLFSGGFEIFSRRKQFLAVFDSGSSRIHFENPVKNATQCIENMIVIFLVIFAMNKAPIVND